MAAINLELLKLHENFNGKRLQIWGDRDGVHSELFRNPDAVPREARDMTWEDLLDPLRDMRNICDDQRRQ